MKKNDTHAKPLSDVAVWLKRLPHLNPTCVIFELESGQWCEEMIEEWGSILDSYDEDSRFRMEAWLSEGGRLDLIRPSTPTCFSFVRLINNAKQLNWLAVGFPKKHGRGFFVVEQQPSVDPDEVWRRLGRFRCLRNSQGMNKQYLAWCIQHAPILIVGAVRRQT